MEAGAAARRPAGDLVQRNRRPTERQGQQPCAVLRGGDESEPAALGCLERLLTQARGLDPFLRHRVRAWALRCGGCFPVKWKPLSGEDAAEGWPAAVVRWAAAVGDVAKRRQVRWRRPKSLRRAVSQLCVLGAESDASVLLDYCRQDIYFESPSDLIECLRAIQADPEAVPLRVFSRLAEVADFAEVDCGEVIAQRFPLCGCGEVAVWLQLDSEGTRRLGLEAHVCQVGEYE